MAGSLPLKGVRVLDLSRVLAGPYCTQVLADLGAEVWKVEAASGDDTRRWGPPFVAGESAYFLSTNRGKKSIVVDFKTAEGQQLIRDMARECDVLVENYRKGTLERYGLGPEDIRAVNPALVYASVTGYGQTGPRSEQPGYDLSLQALSGLMSITGEAGRPPVKLGVAWIDVLTGLFTAVGILASLFERRGKANAAAGGSAAGVSDEAAAGAAAGGTLARRLDVSLFDVAVATLVNQAQAYLVSGIVPQALGSAHPQIVPYQAFEASDGWFVLAVGNDGQFARLVDLLGNAPELLDSRFSLNSGRVAARDELVELLQEHFLQDSRAGWQQKFDAAGIPASPVNSVGEALADPQSIFRQLAVPARHPRAGDVSLLGSPLQHSFPVGSPAAPPLLGADARGILEALGLPEERIAELVAAGAVRLPEADA
jgi:crotonobetainyl-CoA:carnitine CoA-transferase CaiB-like acyl-CoA transferase